MADDMELGGNITLSGFREVDGATMTIVKKIVGNYAKKFSERVDNFEGIKITLKAVHKREKGELCEVHTHLYYQGKSEHIEQNDRNLFVAIDNALKKGEQVLIG